MKLQLHIADQFEALVNGKLLALGLFADRVVVMLIPAEMPDPTPESPHAMQLGLLLTLSDMSDRPLEGEVRILPPGGGKPVGGFSFAGLPIQAGDSTNVVTKLAPLIIPQAGVFSVEAHIGDEVLVASFEVRIRRMAPAASAAVSSEASVIGPASEPAPIKTASGRRGVRRPKT